MVFSSALILYSFNTQPPEGGCYDNLSYIYVNMQFQHTAARRRLYKRVGY